MQKKGPHQALDSLFTVGFGLLMGFVDNKKNVKYQQPYPVTIYST